MLLYVAYSSCPAHGTNVLRQKFRYYFITSNGIIIPIQNLIGPVHILKYSAMLLYKLLWTRQWAFWSLMLHIYIALIKQSSFQVEATLNSIRVFELFRSLAIQTRQKSPFWCLTQFVRAESRRVNLLSSVEKSWVFGVWGDLFPQIITDSTTAGGNPRFLQNLPLQRHTNNTSESGQWYDWPPEASK